MAQLVSAPPCHGGGRGFKSRQGRSNVITEVVLFLQEIVQPLFLFSGVFLGSQVSGFLGAGVS